MDNNIDIKSVTPKNQSIAPKSVADGSDRGPITGFGSQGGRKMGTTGFSKKKVKMSNAQKVQHWENFVKDYMKEGMITL